MSRSIKMETFARLEAAPPDTKLSTGINGIPPALKFRGGFQIECTLHDGKTEVARVANIKIQGHWETARWGLGPRTRPTASRTSR